MDYGTMFDKDNRLLPEYVGKVDIGPGQMLVTLGDGQWPDLGDYPDDTVRILLAMRAPKSRGCIQTEPNRWDIPWGAIRTREEFPDPTHRIAKETLGTKIADPILMTIINHISEVSHWTHIVYVTTTAAKGKMPHVPKPRRKEFSRLCYVSLADFLAEPRVNLTENAHVLRERLAMYPEISDILLAMRDELRKQRTDRT